VLEELRRADAAMALDIIAWSPCDRRNKNAVHNLREGFMRVMKAPRRPPAASYAGATLRMRRVTALRPA